MSGAEEKPWSTWLAKYAVDYAAENAMLVKSKDHKHWDTVGFTLLPRKVSKRCFSQMVDLAEPFNTLVDRVSRNHEWLFRTLEKAANVDPFTRDLLDIAKKVSQEGVAQPISLGIHRSDYMLHHDSTSPSEKPLQVELNTISASFGCLCSKVGEWHRHVQQRFSTEFSDVGTHFQGGQVPENNAIRGMAKAFSEARKVYGGTETAILFVVQSDERNLMDQRILEHEIADGSHSIPCLRYTFRELHGEAAYRDNRLFLPVIPGSSKKYEISVVYFRAGYSPGDYEDDYCWEVRARLETCRAIKCPNIFYQLVGAKKVQQALSSVEVLEKFIDGAAASKLVESFAGLWGLGEEEQDEDTNPMQHKAIEHAKKNPHSYVLKPQREGGGNNLWAKDLQNALTQYSNAELGAFILMERIRPQANQVTMVRGETTMTTSTISEIGIFGIYLGSPEKTELNESIGHLIRTKGETVDEGGVNTGFAVLDSPLLC